MFFLDEVDKLLENLTVGRKQRRNLDRLRISLPDVECIDIEQLQLMTKVRYPSSQSPGLVQLGESPRVFSSSKLIAKHNHLTTDALLFTLMNNFLLPRLNQVAEREFPATKLIFCDRRSYDLLIKFKRVSSKVELKNSSACPGNFIYKRPFSVTAIFLLSDVIDLFERQRVPIILIRRDVATGHQIASFNYSLVRQIFPFLRMSDIILILYDKGTLELGNVNIKGERAEQIIQLLNHFARSTELIELGSFNKLLGKIHLIYDNVIISGHSNVSKTSNIGFNKLTLAQLTFMAEQLAQLAEKLGLVLNSITYRAGDPHGQAKVFSQFVATGASTKQDLLKTSGFSTARVLVLDRFCDIQSALLHADYYGPFLEQEKQVEVLGNRVTESRFDSMDELDERLQLTPLTEVLGTILRYSTDLKPKESGTQGTGRNAIPLVDRSLASLMTKSQSIRRHLDIVKLVYKCLFEGYLLVLRLESSLVSVANQLRSLKEPLTVEMQITIAERLQRIFSAFRHLIKVSGQSIAATDMVRVGCVLVDVVNIFLFIHQRADSSDKAIKIVNGIRQFFTQGKEFRRALRFKSDSDVMSGTKDLDILVDKLVSFDKISRETCGSRSANDLMKTVEKFHLQQLDNNSHPTLNLSERSEKKSQVLILMFLGTITPFELGRLKILERSMIKDQGLGHEIFILAGDLAEPEELLMQHEGALDEMIPAQGCVKNYKWGKVGNDNYIARFQEGAKTLSPLKHNGSTTTKGQETEKPLAELWFGAHTSGPATVTVADQAVKLDTFLAGKPEMVGAIQHFHKFDKKLPFLFKILSIAQPLSLQAHPDKKLAQVLHKKDPKNYPDSNHKPELAIALTEFEILCDFRPMKEIVHFMKTLDPLRQVLNENRCELYCKVVEKGVGGEEYKRSLADCFKALMTSDKLVITKAVKNLLTDCSNSIGKELFSLIDHLNKLYPGDPGVLAPFFLNYMKLAPGQAVYLKANKLHAYLKGECIECMANSDNVVRAGLTPKFRDVDTLISMLDYESVISSQDVLYTGVLHSKDSSVVSYTPTEEFKVDKITVTSKGANGGEYVLNSYSSGSFILIFGGKASATNFFNPNVKHKLALGSAGYIPPKISLKLSDIKDTLIIYRSYC